MAYAIELKDITFSYDGAKAPVLEHLDFALEYGELVLLSGLSGEGKSTLLSIINGIIPHITHGKLEGSVCLDGEDVTKKRVSARAKYVGTVLQNADEQIIYDITRDEVAFGCENFRIPAEEIEQRISTSMEHMRLSPDSFTKTLSGGQKQRLVTASTLAMQQKILLLDEPLANLDSESAYILLDSLKRLAKQGYAVLLVEHRLDMVAAYVDRVLWIREKRLFSSEGVEALLKAEKKIPPKENTGNRSEEIYLSGRGLRFTAGGRNILDGLDVDIYAGERVVLLGENGCGKTTLMRTLARLNRLSSGTLTQTLLPKDRKRKPSAKWFQKVGYVYQNPSYQLFMPTLREEIAYQAASPETAKQMISYFGLEGLEERHPQSLSEGQKRRAGIAAICAGLPKVLFLDEPTVGQDYDNLYKMVQSLNKIHSETGCTIVTVTHDMRCASALADRVLIMENGRIAKTGDSSLADAFFARNISMSSAAL